MTERKFYKIFRIGGWTQSTTERGIVTTYNPTGLYGPYSSYRFSGQDWFEWHRWSPVRCIEPCISGWHAFDDTQAQSWVPQTPPSRVYEVELSRPQYYNKWSTQGKWIGSRFRLVRLVGTISNIPRARCHSHKFPDYWREFVSTGRWPYFGCHR